MKTIGQILKNARQQKGLTAVEAARRSGLTRMTYARIENDQVKTIDLHAVEKIVNATDLDPFLLFHSAKIKFDFVSFEMLIKVVRRLTYRGKEIDTDKLIELLKDNLNNITIE